MTIFCFLENHFSLNHNCFYFLDWMSSLIAEISYMDYFRIKTAVIQKLIYSAKW